MFHLTDAKVLVNTHTTHTHTHTHTHTQHTHTHTHTDTYTHMLHSLQNKTININICRCSNWNLMVIYIMYSLFTIGVILWDINLFYFIDDFPPPVSKIYSFMSSLHQSWYVHQIKVSNKLTHARNHFHRKCAQTIDRLVQSSDLTTWRINPQKIFFRERKKYREVNLSIICQRVFFNAWIKWM